MAWRLFASLWLALPEPSPRYTLGMDALTIRTRATVDEKGELHTEQPLGLAPGEYELTLLLEPAKTRGDEAAELWLPSYPIGFVDPQGRLSREDLYDD